MHGHANIKFILQSLYYCVLFVKLKAPTIHSVIVSNTSVVHKRNILLLSSYNKFIALFKIHKD